MSPRRQLGLVVLVCAAGAVLALVAAGRPWEVTVTPRPAPLPDLRTVHTGADRWPWLPALAWVGLAGAGALVATRGAARRVVGGLLLLAGAGLGGAGLAGTGAGGSWPVLAGLAGLAVAGAGATALAGGRRWPAMGARYQRAGRGGTAGQAGTAGRAGTEGRGRAAPDPAGRSGPELRSRPELLWEALDRGEDPTDR